MSDILALEKKECGSYTATTQCPAVFEEALNTLEAPHPMASRTLENVARFLDEHREATSGVVFESNQMHVLLNPNQPNISKEEFLEKLDPDCRKALLAIPGTSLLGMRYDSSRITILGPQK